VSVVKPDTLAGDDQRSSRSAVARRSLPLDEARADDPQAEALGGRPERALPLGRAHARIHTKVEA
jgi:hypothetical protein